MALATGLVADGVPRRDRQRLPRPLPVRPRSGQGAAGRGVPGREHPRGGHRPRRRPHPGGGGGADQDRPRHRRHPGRAAAPPVRRLRPVPGQRPAGALPAGVDRRLPEPRRVPHAAVLVDLARQPHRPGQPRDRPEAGRRPGRGRSPEAARSLPRGRAAGARPVRGGPGGPAREPDGGVVPGEGLRARCDSARSTEPACRCRPRGSEPAARAAPGRRRGRRRCRGGPGRRDRGLHRAELEESTDGPGRRRRPVRRRARPGSRPGRSGSACPRSRPASTRSIRSPGPPPARRCSEWCCRSCSGSTRRDGPSAGWPTTPPCGRRPTGRRRAFSLRSGARWSDGTPITVDDVRFTLETIRGRAWPGPRAGYDRLTAVEGQGTSVTFRFDGPFPGWRRLFSGADFLLPAHRLAGQEPAGGVEGRGPTCSAGRSGSGP